MLNNWVLFGMRYHLSHITNKVGSTAERPPFGTLDPVTGGSLNNIYTCTI